MSAFSKKARFSGETAFPSLLMVATIFLHGCRSVEPQRPSNVPKETVLVGAGKVGGWWQRCTVEPHSGATFCSIWNAGGLVLNEGIFVPYDQGPAVTADELQIPRVARLPGSDRVCLQNGRILVPRSQFDRMKRFLDWSTGKAATPY
jgi:hypothetical protein